MSNLKVAELPDGSGDSAGESEQEQAKRELDTVFAALGAPAPETIKRTVRPAEKQEPTMAGLRRILGDSVLDIFPVPLMEAVDRSYKIWVANPDSYLPTRFDSEQDKRDSLFVMRAYAECAPEGPYTIRTITDDDPLLLVWRAQTRRGTKDDK